VYIGGVKKGQEEKRKERERERERESDKCDK